MRILLTWIESGNIHILRAEKSALFLLVQCGIIAENPNAGGATMANGEKGKGRSQNQRLKLFYLLDYLLEHTDETHTVKVQQIIEHFDNYHKIPVEQKTVCSDLRLLGEYGYETQ